MGQEVVLHDNASQAELHKATLHAKQITLDNNILTKVITTPPLDSHYVVCTTSLQLHAGGVTRIAM